MSEEKKPESVENTGSSADDLIKDPNELNNVYESPEYTEIVIRLKLIS